MDQIIELLKHPATPWLIGAVGVIIIALLIEQVVGILEDKRDDGEF